MGIIASITAAMLVSSLLGLESKPLSCFLCLALEYTRLPLWLCSLKGHLGQGAQVQASRSSVFLQQMWSWGAPLQTPATAFWQNLELGCFVVRGGTLNRLERQQQADRLPRNRRCSYANVKHYFSFATFLFSHRTNPTLQQVHQASSAVHGVSVKADLIKTILCVW